MDMNIYDEKFEVETIQAYQVQENLLRQTAY